MRNLPKRQAHGYILAATLVLLALMSVIAVRLAARVDLLREQSSSVADLAQVLANASSARARALHLMATARITRSGFQQPTGKVVPVDGRYADLTPDSPSGIRVAIQDERGLLSLNLPDRPALMHLLVQQGVPEQSVDHLIDCLEDYTDTDSLRRLNGAEAPDYEALGLPPPRNDWLESPHELRQIIGWRDYPAVIDQLMPLFSSRRDGFYNANAAPRAVLTARFARAPAEQIDTFISRRSLRPFADAAEARSVTGLPFSQEWDIFYPSDQYRLTIRSPDVSIAVEYTVRLTPGGRKRPWQFLDARTVFLEKMPVSQISDIPSASRLPLEPNSNETPSPQAF